MDTSHQSGRPSKVEQLEIENKIYPYFTKFFGPETVSQITGYNIKTVRKYFNKFHSRIRIAKDKDFVKEWQITKKNAGIALELERAELLELQSSLKKQFKAYEKNGEQVPSWMYKESRRLSESIQNMILSLVNLELSPTADVTLKNQTRQLLQEHGLNQ